MNRSLSFKDGANNLVKTKKLGNDLVHNIHHISDAGSSEDDEEDEASMSIFAALNNKADGHISDPQSNKVNFDFTNMKENSINNSMDNKKSLNFNFDQNLHSPGLNHSIFRNRQETNAYKRAEQSLQRMRSRKRSKPKFSFSTVSSSTGGYLSSNIFLQNNSTKSQSTLPLIPNSTVDLSKPATAILQPTKINASGTTSHSVIDTSKSEGLQATPTMEDYISDTSETLLFHLRQIVNQTLLDQGVEEDLIKKWTFLIEDLVICYDRIKIHTKLSDSLDYRQYIKIKRISGGKIEDSKFVNGLIFQKIYH